MKEGDKHFTLRDMRRIVNQTNRMPSHVWFSRRHFPSERLYGKKMLLGYLEQCERLLVPVTLDHLFAHRDRRFREGEDRDERLSREDAIKLLDKMISEHGAHYPVRDSAKQTAEVAPTNNQDTDERHGGDGSSGEVEECEPTDSPSPAQLGEDQKFLPDSPQGDQGAPENRQEGPCGGDSPTQAEDSETSGSQSSGEGSEGENSQGVPGGTATPAGQDQTGQGQSGASSSAESPGTGMGTCQHHGLGASGEGDCITSSTSNGTSPQAARGEQAGESVTETCNEDHVSASSTTPKQSPSSSPTGEAPLKHEDPSSFSEENYIAAPEETRGFAFTALKDLLFRKAEELEGSNHSSQRKWLRSVGRQIMTREGSSLEATLSMLRKSEHPSTLNLEVQDAIHEVELEVLEGQKLAIIGGGGRNTPSASHLSMAEAKQHLEVLKKERISRRLKKALENYLEEELGAVGEATPRISAKKLAVELAGKSYRLARARKEEFEKSTAIFAVDDSGSCSVHCAETMAAAILLSREDERLVVVVHCNGTPRKIYHRGMIAELPKGDAYASNAFLEPNVAAMLRHEQGLGLQDVVTWLGILKQYHTKAMIWLGDSDGINIRKVLAEQGGVQLTLFDAYTSSLEKARPCRSGPRHEYWTKAHFVGVASAKTVLEALSR